VIKALLDSDWVQMGKQAAALNRELPMDYVFFWDRGLALVQLGREHEAVEALLENCGSNLK